MKRTTAVVFAAAVLSSGAALAAGVPAGWKVIKDNGKGRCQMAVPADWKEQDLMGQRLGAANAPDKSVDSVVNMMDDTDWKSFHSMIHMVYEKEKDRPKIEDSGKRMWFDIVSMPVQGKTSWYVAVPAGKDATCNAQVNFRKGDKKAEEIARKIVDSIQGS